MIYYTCPTYIDPDLAGMPARVTSIAKDIATLSFLDGSAIEMPAAEVVEVNPRRRVPLPTHKLVAPALYDLRCDCVGLRNHRSYPELTRRALC